MSTTGSAGGHLIPLTLDPAILLSNDGSNNPLRRLATVKTTATNAWQGATSAGVTSEIEGPIATGDQVGDELKIRQLPLWRIGTWRFLIGLLKVGVMNAPRVKSVVTFRDGDVLDLPGSPEVVYTPGHATGHASFYLRQNKTLFTGDALVTRDLLNHHDADPQLMPDVFHTDPAQARESLGILSALDTELVLPGHGSPYRGQVAEAAKTALG